MEEEATRIQQERLTAEEENRTLRETVFESQGRTRAAEAALKKVQAEAADRDKQLRIMTDQNAELLRLLEEEEAQTTRLNAAHEVTRHFRVTKSVHRIKCSQACHCTLQQKRRAVRSTLTLVHTLKLV